MVNLEMKDRETLINYVLPTLIYMILVFSISLMSLPRQISLSASAMYTLHLFEFFILAVLVYRLMKHSGAGNPKFYAAAFTALIGFLSEAAQLLVTYRAFSLTDLLFDMIGAALVVFL